MNYKALIRKLHYPNKLSGIVEEYASVGDKRLDKLLNFIRESTDDELDEMADDLKKALRKRIKNNSVNERIYEDDLGLYYDHHAHGYKFKESWMGGRKKRRKRGGTVGYGERCGTNEDCDDGLKCDLERLLSGPQVDNNQRGTCKGGRRRRRKRTRRKKKSKRRRRRRKSRRKKRKSRKKRRRRTRKGGWSLEEQVRLKKRQDKFPPLWELYGDIYIQALQSLSELSIIKDWKNDFSKEENIKYVLDDADIIIPAIASWGIALLKVIDNAGPSHAADSMPDESQVERLKKAIGEFGSSTMVSLVQHTKEYKQDMQEKKLMAEIRAGKNLKKTKKTP